MVLRFCSSKFRKWVATGAIVVVGSTSTGLTLVAAEPMALPTPVSAVSVSAVPVSAVQEENISLRFSRVLGFRPQEFFNERSDYSFQVDTEGNYEYRAFNSRILPDGYVLNGKLSISIEEFESRIAKLGVDAIAAPDPNEPQIADAPECTIQRPMIEAEWSRKVSPYSEIGKGLDALVSELVMGVREPAEGMLVKVLESEAGSAQKPSLIESADELTELMGEEAETWIETIDFEKQKALVFRWNGSGQDEMYAFRTGEGDEAKLTVVYQGGMTRDLRPHARVYVIDKGVDFEVVKQDPPRFR